MKIWKLRIEKAGEVFSEELFNHKPNLENLQKLFDYYAERDYHNLFLHEHEILKLIENYTYNTSTCSYYLEPVEVRTVQKQNKVNCSIFPMASVEVEGVGEFVKLTVSGRSGEKQSVVLNDRSLRSLSELLMLNSYCG